MFLIRNRFFALVLLLLLAVPSKGDVVISELMASNTRTLADEDGEFSDWLELFNPGSTPVDLNGWYLTDLAIDLQQWRLPAKSIAPNGFLVVFASGKDRKDPARPLHTNFKLSGSGEYLALVKPDGVTVAAQFAPKFQQQAADVSYGFPIQQTVTKLVATGTVARIVLPTSDLLGLAWTAPEFDDSAWTLALSGIGFETDDPAESELLADSQADFAGTQGFKKWTYGFYNKTTDRTTGYQTTNFVAFPSSEGAPGDDNFWNGALWDWFNGNPPRDEIGPDFMRPNGANSGEEHWTIRRWQNAFTGPLSIEWRAAKLESGGNGVAVRVLNQAAQVDIATLAGTDLVGVTRTNAIMANAGNFIDFALSPVGPNSVSEDANDRTLVTAKIRALANLTNEIKTDIEAAMRGVSPTVFARWPFNVANPAAFDFLALRMKYDAGFVAYLNGIEVARANVPGEVAWNSTAATERLDSDALAFQEFDISSRRDLLRAGQNVLAIHGLNANVADTDFLLAPELVATASTLKAGALRYFTAPTPGKLNGVGNTNLGPMIFNAKHLPKTPLDGENVQVTAEVAVTFRAVQSVSMTYRVMFGSEVTVTMWDDGAHGDGAAGDRIFGAMLPASASTPGQMVRYFIRATDTAGNGTRLPLYPDPIRSPQYFGLVVANPAVASALPIFEWFIQNPNGAESSGGARGSVFFKGQFLDNINANLHGQSSAGFRKHSFDFDLNPGDHLEWAEGAPLVDDFNLLTTYPDKAMMRNMLSYGIYKDAGAPYHFVFPVRVQRNGAFYSVAHFVENGDENYLQRLGMDTRGALYKMYNSLDSATGEKKTRKEENMSDLTALIAGCNRTGAAKAAYLYDNINVPEVINFLAAMVITGNVDCCHKNYYLYRDTEGTGEWQMLPWDQDLSFGRVWNNSQTYWDEVLHANTAALFVGGNNTLPAAVFATATLADMYKTRLRTLMETLMQPTNTPPAERKFEQKIVEWTRVLEPDAALDLAAWKTFGQGAEISTCCVQTLSNAVSILTDQYLPARRNFLFRSSGIPPAPPANPIIKFGALEYNPASRNQAEEYIELINTNKAAIDVSGWTLTGAVKFTFAPGTVLAVTNRIYVSPDVTAFRRRASGPRGGQGLFVQGKYPDQLSARGGTITLLDSAGRTVNALTYAGAPSLAQRFLRITEIMFHPSPAPAPSGFEDEDFEYIEIKNTATVPLDLGGMRFSNGIDFTFPTLRLGAGEFAVVVKNGPAFRARYGDGPLVAGEYVGGLDNAGEKIELVDAACESILEFSYNDTWFPTTDGAGSSLVIVHETGPWDAWGARESWQESVMAFGSPGEDDSARFLWLQLYFSSAERANLAVSGDTADPDADGVTNIQERIAGTNPRDSASILKMTAATTANNTVLRFVAAVGKTYSLQARASLSDGVWTTVLQVPAAANSREIVFSESIANARFYRVITPQAN